MDFFLQHKNLQNVLFTMYCCENFFKTMGIKNVERETSPNKLVRILHLNEVNMSLGSEATDRG